MRTGDDESRTTELDRRRAGASEELKPVNAKKGPSRADGHEEKTRHGTSPPTPESTVVGPVSLFESQERQGGNEGTRFATYEGAKRSMSENNGGQAG